MESMRATLLAKMAFFESDRFDYFKSITATAWAKGAKETGPNKTLSSHQHYKPGTSLGQTSFSPLLAALGTLIENDRDFD